MRIICFQECKLFFEVLDLQVCSLEINALLQGCVWVTQCEVEFMDHHTFCLLILGWILNVHGFPFQLLKDVEV